MILVKLKTYLLAITALLVLFDWAITQSFAKDLRKFQIMIIIALTEEELQ